MELQTVRELNPFEQQPNLFRLYTQLCYVYHVPADVVHEQIEQTLEKGLSRLADSFPWIAGQVVNEGAREASSGTYSVRPLNQRPELIIRDLRGDPSAPTQRKLSQANYPISMFSEDVVAPRKTLDMAFGKPADPANVFLVQANYIDSGLLLTIATQHNVMDMTGQAEISRLLAKACRGEEFTEEELKIGNYSSKGVIGLLDDNVADLQAELLNQSTRSLELPAESPNANTQPQHPPECTWAYINFDAEALTTIKAEATKSVTSGFISTDDALSAFIWRATTRARLPRLSPNRNIKFARAIDPRRYLAELPSSYPGIVQNMAYSMSTIDELVNSKPLGHTATLLRAAVDPKTSNLERNTRALATLLDKTNDKTSINVTGSLDLAADIMLSSWAAVKCYDDDFGFGCGKPQMVRRPGFTPVESLMYLLPKTPTGDITAMVCLRNEDMDRLRNDAEFTKLGSFVE